MNPVDLTVFIDDPVSFIFVHASGARRVFCRGEGDRPAFIVYSMFDFAGFKSKVAEFIKYNPPKVLITFQVMLCQPPVKFEAIDSQGVLLIG